MSSSGQREAVFPTRMTLNVTKSRLKGAQTGHSLLKRKADALTKRFRTITGKIDEAKRKMGRVMQLAAFSLAEVQYVTGEIGYVVQESVKSATFKVQAKQENVSGVLLPAFEAQPGSGSSTGKSPIFQRLVPLGRLTHLAISCRIRFDWSFKRWTASSKGARRL